MLRFVLLLVFTLNPQQDPNIKIVPKVNFQFKKLNNREAVNNLNDSINDPTRSVNLNQLWEPWLEDLLQPTHSSF